MLDLTKSEYMTQKENELTSDTNPQQLLPIPERQQDETSRATKKRGRGRPKGSKNKPKLFAPQQVQKEEGWHIDYAEGAASVAKPRSGRLYRKWQREWIKPQFVLSRKEAYNIFLNYLRSAAGKTALRDIIIQGSIGIGKMSDSALAKYLEKTNLLSRYPHDVVLKSDEQ